MSGSNLANYYVLLEISMINLANYSPHSIDNKIQLQETNYNYIYSISRTVQYNIMQTRAQSPMVLLLNIAKS